VKQISFSEAEFAAKRRVTRRERLLADMEQVIPWQDVLAIIELHYPKWKRGRPPIGLARMLRVYLIQQWYGLSDEGMEDAVSDSQALRGFVRIDLSQEAVPDATTLLHFRHLLEEKDLSKAVLAAINAQLAATGLMMREGTIADATILAAPLSAKSEAEARDPEMHQTKKGNHWHLYREARRVKRPGHRLASGDQAQQAEGGPEGEQAWRTAASPGIGQGERPLEGRAPLSHRDESLQPSQGPLQGAEEEHGAVAHPLCAGQSRHRQASASGPSQPRCVLSTEKGPERKRQRPEKGFEPRRNRPDRREA